MSARVVRLVLILIGLTISITAAASHWLVNETSSSLKEYLDTDLGRVSIEITQDKNPVVVVQGHHFEVLLSNLNYSDSIDYHSAFLARDSEELETNIVFNCLDGESVVYMKISKSVESGKIQLGQINHNGCNDS